jgi:hypothetical protein
MENKFDDIEKKLREILSNGLYADREELFNLGVELGRRFSEHKIDDFRLDTWINLEKNHNRVNLIIESERKIEEFIAKLLRLSILHQIKVNGSWSIARGGGYGMDRFEDEVVEQFNVQVVNCEMDIDGGDFVVNFEVTGELARIFDKYNISKRFETVIINHHGTNDQQLYDTKDLRSYISNINAHIRNSNNWELDEYEKFLQEISKPFIFYILTYSQII